MNTAGRADARAIEASARTRGACERAATRTRLRRPRAEPRVARTSCVDPLDSGPTRTAEVGEQQGGAHELLDRRREIVQRLECLDLGQQLVGILEIVRGEVLVQQGERLV